MLDKKRVNKLMHDILDYQFNKLKEEMITNVFGSDKENVDEYRFRLSKESFNIQQSPWAVINEQRGLSFIKKAYRADSDLPDDVVREIKELLGENINNRHFIPSEFNGDKWPVIDEDSETCKDVRTLAYMAQRTRGVALATGCHDLTFNEIDRKRAHEDLSQFHPLEEVDTKHKWAGALDKLLAKHAEKTASSVSELTIRGVINEYISESANKGNDIKTEEERRAALNLFCEAEDVDKPISHLTPQMMIDFDDILTFLPTRKETKYPGVMVSDFRTNARRYANDDKLSTKTKLKRLAMVRAFVNWMPKRSHCSFDEAKRLSITLSERMRAHQKKYDKVGGSTRTAFTVEELARLFDCEAYLKATNKAPERFWLPLLALYTGARTQDLLALRRCDIKITPEQPDIARLKCGSVDEDASVVGIPYIDLTDTMEKELKTARSNRVIPIHPFIWETLGFGNYVQSFESKQSLFGDQIKANGELSDSFGKWFTRYRRSVCVGRQAGDKVGRDVVFHSFRHTVKRDLRLKRCDESIVHEVIGHDDGTETKVSMGYAGSFMIEQKLEGAIKHLDFEKSIDLACLSRSKWAKNISG